MAFTNESKSEVYVFVDGVQVMVPPGGTVDTETAEVKPKKAAAKKAAAKKAAAKKAVAKVEKPAGQVHAEAKAAEVTDPPAESK